MEITFAAYQSTIWLYKILSELKNKQKGPTKILCDHKFAIALTKDPNFRGKSKQIRIQFHYIRELLKDQEIIIEFCRSKDQVANIFTKPLKENIFEKLKMVFVVIDFKARIKVGC